MRQIDVIVINFLNLTFLSAGTTSSTLVIVVSTLVIFNRRKTNSKERYISIFNYYKLTIVSKPSTSIITKNIIDQKGAPGIVVTIFLFDC
jgi:hypothetical protein